MNGKFSKTTKVLAALVSVFMLIACMPLGSFAAAIDPEAVVYVATEVTDIVSNQIGMNYIYVDVTTAGSDNDMPAIAYLVDANGELVTATYNYVNADSVEIKLGVPDSYPTATYTVVVALHRATDVAKSEIFYIGVDDVKGFYEAVNMTDVEAAAVKEKLDAHYHALSVVACTEDEEGNVIVKMTGADYEALSEEGKEAFAELVLSGVNGKYIDGKGQYDAENSEAFIKDAYVTASYNAEGFSNQELADVIYKHATTIGFDANDKDLYGKIQNRDTLVKVVKTMASTVSDVAELKTVLEQAAAVQLVNETHWNNRVAIIEANNDLFQIDEDEIEELLDTKKLRNIFCEEFNNTYYSIDEIKEAWEEAYDIAEEKYEDSQKDKGGSGGGGGGGTGKVTGNLVSVPIENSENNKDKNVKIEDYYTDMGTYQWASDAILNLTRNEIVSGYGDMTFRPANSVTRAEFMKMVVNVFGLADITATSTFADVQADSWYYIYVASAEKLGIAQGYGNGLFGVNDPVTRQDAITIVYRAAQIKGLSLDKFRASIDKFVDKDSIASYAYEAVSALHNAGVYLDASDPTRVDVFEPTRNASRAYLAVILNQIYMFMNN